MSNQYLIDEEEGHKEKADAAQPNSEIAEARLGNPNKIQLRNLNLIN